MTLCRCCTPNTHIPSIPTHMDKSMQVRRSRGNAKIQLHAVGMLQGFDVIILLTSTPLLPFSPGSSTL